jgi:hypothetical protein
LTAAKFEAESQDMRVMYALVCKVGKEVPGFKFDDYPPMIQHAIDLVPGVVFPNLFAYRMLPVQRVAMQRQVEGLIAKGLVPESKLPCLHLKRSISMKDVIFG